jgi:hypothetical protein
MERFQSDSCLRDVPVVTTLMGCYCACVAIVFDIRQMTKSRIFLTVRMS